MSFHSGAEIKKYREDSTHPSIQECLVASYRGENNIINFLKKCINYFTSNLSCITDQLRLPYHPGAEVDFYEIAYHREASTHPSVQGRLVTGYRRGLSHHHHHHLGAEIAKYREDSAYPSVQERLVAGYRRGENNTINLKKFINYFTSNLSCVTD